MPQVKEIVKMLKQSERNNGNKFCYICGDDQCHVDFNWEGRERGFLFEEEVCDQCFGEVEQLDSRLP